MLHLLWMFPGPQSVPDLLRCVWYWSALSFRVFFLIANPAPSLQGLLCSVIQLWSPWTLLSLNWRPNHCISFL